MTKIVVIALKLCDPFGCWVEEHPSSYPSLELCTLSASLGVQLLAADLDVRLAAWECRLGEGA